MTTLKRFFAYYLEILKRGLTNPTFYVWIIFLMLCSGRDLLGTMIAISATIFLAFPLCVMAMERWGR